MDDGIQMTGGLVAAKDPDAGPLLIWWMSIVLAIIGRSGEAIGMMVQKNSLDSADSKNVDPPSFFGCRCYCLQLRWLKGFGTYAIGHLLVLVSNGMGTLTVLSCLLLWCTVTTIALAPLITGEVVTCTRRVGACIIIIGCVWVVFHGPRFYEVYTVELLQHQAQNVTFHWVTAVMVVTLALFGLRVALTPQTLDKPRLGIIGATWIAAVIGWYSVLAMKCFSGLVLTTWYEDDNQLNCWEMWVLVSGGILGAVLNMHFINLALSMGEAGYVIPVYECMSMIGQILLSGIFFQEFEKLSPTNTPLFFVGVAVVIVGVVVVAKGTSHNNGCAVVLHSPFAHIPLLAGAEMVNCVDPE